MHGDDCFGAGRGDRGEHRAQARREFVRIGRNDELAAGRSGDAGKRLHIFRLLSKADDGDVQSLGLLLESVRRDTDIRVAGVGAVGNEDDVCRGGIFACRSGRIADGRSDRRLALGLDAVEEFFGRLGVETARLSENFAVRTIRGFAVTEGDEAEREPAGESVHGLS